MLPQPSQTKQEPAGRIFVPQVKQIGASDAIPTSFSSSSAEECTSTGAGLTAAAGPAGRSVLSDFGLVDGAD